jgi:uncharacterized protein
MKIIFLSLLLVTSLIVPAFALDLPEPTDYIVDTINLLKADTITTIKTVCKELDPKAQLAVVVVNSTQPYAIEQWSIKLAEKWKVGYKGKDNGVILILAKGDRKVRIEVGRGLESILTDAKAGRIINNVIIPYFKRGDWDGGLIAGIDAIKKELK